MVIFLIHTESLIELLLVLILLLLLLLLDNLIHCPTDSLPLLLDLIFWLSLLSVLPHTLPYASAGTRTVQITLSFEHLLTDVTGLRAIFEQGKIDLDILTIFKFFLKEELSIGKVIGFVIRKLIELFFGGRVKILQKVTVEVADSKTEHDQT